MAKEEKKAPKLRFNGYTNDWERKKLGEIGSVSMNKRIFKDETSTIGEIPFYKIGTFGGKADAFITREKYEEYKKKYPYPQKGNLLISASGSIGRIIEYNGEEAYYQDSNIVWLDHDNTILDVFLKPTYEIIKWDGIEGTTIKRLYNKNILNTVIYKPTIDEQRKIGKLFIILNNTIQLHERKCEELNLIKKALLQKLFPKKDEVIPEVRYKSFSAAWEQRKFSEFATYSGKRNKDNLDLEPYAITSDNGFVRQSEAHNEFGYMKNTDRAAYKIVQSNSFGYNPARINIGSIGYYSGNKNIIVSSLYEIFKTNQDVNDDFLWVWFKSNRFQEWVNKLQEGSVRLYFYYDKLRETKIQLPNLEEQSQVADLFTNLDSLITLHQRKLEKLKQLKKFLLQNMFI